MPRVSRHDSPGSLGERAGRSSRCQHSTLQPKTQGEHYVIRFSSSPVDSPDKGPVTRKMFQSGDVIKMPDEI